MRREGDIDGTSQRLRTGSHRHCRAWYSSLLSRELEAGLGRDIWDCCFKEFEAASRAPLFFFVLETRCDALRGVLESAVVGEKRGAETLWRESKGGLLMAQRGKIREQ